MSVLFLTQDLMFSSRLAQAGQRAGVTVRVLGNPDALVDVTTTDSPGLVILDISTPGLDVEQAVASIRSVGEGTTVIAYGPHVHHERLEAAQSAGCDVVLSKGQFNSQIDTIVSRHASGA